MLIKIQRFGLPKITCFFSFNDPALFPLLWEYEFPESFPAHLPEAGV
jgi:hypothetical protein